MGIKWTATLKVEFELVDGQEEGLARVVLTREVDWRRQALSAAQPKSR